jgi:ribosome-associated protein
VELAARTISAHKGLDLVILEVKELCSFADYFIIASGTSRRQVLALAQYLEEALTQTGVKPLGVEGIQEGLWVLMDYNTVVIHIFYRELREFYNLEGLWSEAPKMPLETGTEAASTPPPP